MTSIEISNKTYNKLSQIAKEKNMSINDLAERIISSYIAKHEKRPHLGRVQKTILSLVKSQGHITRTQADKIYGNKQESLANLLKFESWGYLKLVQPGVWAKGEKFKEIEEYL